MAAGQSGASRGGSTGGGSGLWSRVRSTNRVVRAVAPITTAAPASTILPAARSSDLGERSSSLPVPGRSGGGYASMLADQHAPPPHMPTCEAVGVDPTVAGVHYPPLSAGAASAAVSPSAAGALAAAVPRRIAKTKPFWQIEEERRAAKAAGGGDGDGGEGGSSSDASAERPDAYSAQRAFLAREESRERASGGEGGATERPALALATLREKKRVNWGEQGPAPPLLSARRHSMPERTSPSPFGLPPAPPGIPPGRLGGEADAAAKDAAILDFFSSPLAYDEALPELSSLSDRSASLPTTRRDRERQQQRQQEQGEPPKRSSVVGGIGMNAMRLLRMTSRAKQKANTKQMTMEL